MKYKISTILFIFILPFLSAQGGRMKQNSTAFFETQYDDPVIEEIEGSHKKVFPSLTLYSVFEKRNLVEDPLIPETWILTATGNFFTAGNIAEALKEDRLFPGSPAEALAFAREIVRIKHDCYYMIDGDQSFDGLIPKIYNDPKFHPSVTQTSNGFIVNIHVYYPNRRYAEFFSPYRENLVEYIVACDGQNYSVKTGRMYRKGIDSNEMALVQTITDHIVNRSLLDDLEEFLAKRAIYGITDPPDHVEIKRRRDELSSLWEQALTGKHPELYFLTRKALERNPEFRFDTEAIHEKTKDIPDVQNVEYYRSTLDAVLMELVQRSSTE